MQPQIIINAKVYPQVTGTGTLELAKACQTVAEEVGAAIALAPPQVELAAIGRRDDLRDVPIFAQHTDKIPPGSGTGLVTAEAIQAAGAVGSILNHAEHKILHDDIAAALVRMRELDLQSLVCADSMEEAELLTPLAPTYVAVEPPELIGGDVSVTSADPAIVRDTAARIRDLSPDVLPLCGAGVKTGKDVTAALELGAHGVLLASGVVKADDPAAALRDLASGL